LGDSVVGVSVGVGLPMAAVAGGMSVANLGPGALESPLVLTAARRASASTAGLGGMRLIAYLFTWREWLSNRAHARVGPFMVNAIRREVARRRLGRLR
jgi:hypothetical protein